jgi:hypothetical protein
MAAQLLIVRSPSVLFDPYQMQAVAQRLQRAGLPIEEYPQSAPNLTAASQNLYELIQGNNLRVYPDAAMRLAISRAVAIETTRGWRIAKEKASHKIDVLVALAMACHAAVEGQASAPLKIHPDNLATMRMAVPHSRYGRRVPMSSLPHGLQHNKFTLLNEFPSRAAQARHLQQDCLHASRRLGGSSQSVSQSVAECPRIDPG